MSRTAYNRINRKTLTRQQFKELPEWTLSDVGEVVITSYRKPKWVALSVDEFERLKTAAGEPFDLTE